MFKPTPLKPITNKLYDVRLEECYHISGIEAPNAHEAIAQAEKCHPKFKGKTVDCSAQSIYEAGIYLQDDNEHATTEDGIFEINIRGCDPARVQALQMALVQYLGCPSFEADEIGKIDPLLEALKGLSVEDFN